MKVKAAISRNVLPKRIGLVAVIVLALGLALALQVTAQEPVEYPDASGVHSYPGAMPSKSPTTPMAPPLGGANVLVNVPPDRAQNETTIAINPTNPYNLIGGANDYRNGPVNCGTYFSTDRGATWTTVMLPLEATFSEAGDPGVAFNAAGHAYFLCMNFIRDANDATQYVYKSFDGGATWGPGILAAGSPHGNFDDKGHIAVDARASSPYKGNVYVAFARLNLGEVKFNRSTDGGNSFTGCPGACADVAVNDVSGGSGANISVGAAGSVYLGWNRNYDSGGDPRAQIRIDKSTDGGVAWNALGGDVVIRDFLRDSTGSGRPAVRPLARVNFFPVFGTHPTNDSEVYAVWMEDVAGTDDSDIYFARSTDGGATWSAPKRVNDDVNPVGDFHSQFFPWMSVDPIDGEIDIVWYDDRNDPNRADGTPLVDLYFASSSDGGLSFSKNLRVSTQSSDITTDFGGGFFGDYNGIASYGGVAHPLWCDSRLGNQDLMTVAVGGADLRITKTDSPDPVVAGTPLLYTITVFNDGPAAAFNVTVVDTLPGQVDYDTGPSFCSLAGNVLTCEVGTLAAGASTSFTIQVTPQADAAGAGGSSTMVNTATVSSDQTDPDTSDNTATASTTVREQANLAVTKDCKPDRDGTPFYAGETATCTIVVSNLGPSTARDVSLVDAHVSNGTFEFASVTPGSCTTTANPQVLSGTVTCNNLGDIDPGQSVEVSVQLTADNAQDINDTATVSSATPDSDTTNNQAKDSITVIASADLAITKTATPSPVVAGKQLTYDLEVTNNGPSTAVNVVIEDVLPAGVSIVSVTANPVTSCNTGVPGNALLPTTCAFDSLTDGAVATMQIVVKVDPSVLGVLGNNARVYSDTYDPDNSNNLDTTATGVDAEADLSVTKADYPDPVLAGDQLTYTLTVYNAGPSTAVDVTLMDVLPVEVSYQGYTVSNGTGTCSLLPGPPDTVDCDLNDLLPGQSVTVVIDVLVDASVPNGTVIVDEATVSSATPDPDLSNNTATEETTVLAEADLALGKDANFLTDNPAPRIVYTLWMTNTGPSDAQDVVVVDTLPLTPKKIVYVMDSGNGACVYEEGPHTVTCDFGTVAAGEVVTVDIIVDARGSVGRITNVADVTSSTTDPDLSNNHAEKEIRVKGGPGPKK